MKKIVIALGGNALGNTPAEQLELVMETAKPIVDLIQEGNQVVVVHGNGPQVGMINLGLASAARTGAIKSDMPFPECGAMSQGYIGYHLQNALENEFTRRGMDKDVCTVVTQVLVDESDPAFENPTKPIGNFYDREVAEKIMRELGGYTEDEIERVKFLIAHHHTYDGVDGADWQILLEADFLVNAYEGSKAAAVPGMREKLFRTKTGLAFLDAMFDPTAYNPPAELP